MGGTSPTTLLEFAEQVTSRLQDHCSALNRDISTRRFSQKLGAELWPIQDWLGENSGDPRVEGDKKVQRKVQSLLGKFTDICMVSQARTAAL